MKIYVATKAESYKRAREVMEAFRDEGHEITYDWTTYVEQSQVPDKEVHSEISQHQAQSDLLGVYNADVYVLIGRPGITGALVEYGAALATGTEVYLMGDMPRYTIFYELVTPHNKLPDSDYGVECVLADLAGLDRPDAPYRPEPK